MPETQYFSHTITLSPQSSPPGLSFPAKLAYQTIGSPSNPAVLLPTCFSGTLAKTTPFLYSASDAPDSKTLFSPDKYFIILAGLFGGSESSSPSNTPPPYDGPRFPQLSYEDNIRAQHALCRSLGVDKVFAYIGFSMGGQQAYHMSVLFPEFVQRIVVLAGSARTSAHNWSFLEGPRNALVHSVDFQDGAYSAAAPPVRGLKAFHRVYATWALSPEWFRGRCWRQAGHASLEDFLDANWSGEGKDANDLLAMLATWQKGDISVYFPEDGGDLAKTLKRIHARALVMPSRTDCYFWVADSEEEVKHLPNADLRVIDSVWGHIAGAGGAPDEDKRFMIQEIGRFCGV